MTTCACYRLEPWSLASRSVSSSSSWRAAPRCPVGRPPWSTDGGSTSQSLGKVDRWWSSSPAWAPISLRGIRSSQPCRSSPPRSSTADPATARASRPAPRSARFVVEELRATLRKEGLAPPYVLVGHSLGGLHLQLFARRYPQEVAALLLLDSSHPSQMSGARGHPPITAWTTLLRLYMSGTRGQEFRALDASGRDVLRAPALTGQPVIVLNAGVDPTRSGRPLTEHEQLRVDLFRLYPGCQQRCGLASWRW